MLMLMLVGLLIGSIGATYSQTQDKCGIRVGNQYSLCGEQIETFRRDGLAILDNLLSESEIRQLELLYDEYMATGSPDKQGKDFCDMSQPFGTPRDQWRVINGMLPRVYHPQFQRNIFEKVAKDIASQLFPDADMLLDYDQLLDKKPDQPGAIFAWHQDMAYWPSEELTPDTRTVTFSLALDSTTAENGCIKYIKGSGKNKKLRNHRPLGANRDEAHAVCIDVDESEGGEAISLAEVSRGAASIHDEWIVHGSSGNLSDGPRRTYVIAFRVRDTVERERRAGFTHSHNDHVNWDSFRTYSPGGVDGGSNREL
jgi:hypothetical protein